MRFDSVASDDRNISIPWLIMGFLVSQPPQRKTKTEDNRANLMSESVCYRDRDPHCALDCVSRFCGIGYCVGEVWNAFFLYCYCHVVMSVAYVVLFCNIAWVEC